MKKKIGIIIFIIIIILLVVVAIATIMDNKENWITNNDKLYAKAIEYIKKERKENGYNNEEQDYQVFTDYKGFGIEEKDNKKYAYMWILEESYYVKNGKLRSSEGSSMPYKFTFENDDVIDYEIPKDGTYYESSIRDMFPNSIENKVLMYNMDDSKLKTQVKEHYRYLNSTEIIHVDPDEEIILYTGYYGGYTKKQEANSIKGKCIDRYGHIYEYKIPCNENEEMLIDVNKINKDVVEKYKGKMIDSLNKKDIDIILDNINNVNDKYKNTEIKLEDSPYSFVYMLTNENQKELLIYNNEGTKENTSEGAKIIIDIIAKNDIIYLYD